MTAVRIGFLALLGYLAVAAQSSFVSNLALAGAPLLLVLAVAVAIGYATDSQTGAIAGFLLGLVADLAPPATQTAGRWALTCAVAGYLAAAFVADNRDETDRLTRVGLRTVSAFLACAVGLGLFVATGAILSESQLGIADLGRLIGSYAYTAVVAVLIGAPITWVAHRIDGLRRPRRALP